MTLIPLFYSENCWHYSTIFFHILQIINYKYNTLCAIGFITDYIQSLQYHKIKSWNPLKEAYPSSITKLSSLILTLSLTVHSRHTNHRPLPKSSKSSSVPMIPYPKSPTSNWPSNRWIQTRLSFLQNYRRSTQNTGPSNSLSAMPGTHHLTSALSIDQPQSANRSSKICRRERYPHHSSLPAKEALLLLPPSNIGIRTTRPSHTHLGI